MTTPDALAAGLLGPVLLHMGSLHAYEKALVVLLAFGPFVVLAVVVHLVRRRDIAAEEREARAGAEAGTEATPAPGTAPGADRP